MIVAIMHTENFQWVALGLTEQEAREAIGVKWLAASDYHRWAMGVKALDEFYGITCFPLEPGQAVFE